MSRVVAVMVTDNGTLTWQPAGEYTGEGHNPEDIHADGWLFGPVPLTTRVRELLDPESEVESVPVMWSRYTFTEQRDTPADVIAAMHATGMGRGLLNEHGWGILNAAMPELVDPENNQDDVIY